MTAASPPPRHERTFRPLHWGSLAAATVAPVVVLGLGAPALASGILPGHNPPANIQPNPDFTTSGTCNSVGTSWECANPCVSSQLTFPVFTNAPACTNYVLEAIDAARKAEKVAPMVLPTNWHRLDPQEQLFVLADLERVGRGLPPYLGLNRELTKEAQRASKLDGDPSLAPGFAVGLDAEGLYGMGGAWSTGFSTLVADYFWMYADGWGGSKASTTNLACTAPTAPACWAHRDELLGYDPRFNPGVGLECRTCEMGTGFSIVDGRASLTDLVELPAGRPPAMTFTWARDVVPYLPQKSPTKSSHALRDTVALQGRSTWPGTPFCSSPHPSVPPAACHHSLHSSGQVARSTQREER